MSKIKYKYLYAWDRMMGSLGSWFQMNQQRATEEKAPETAIYRDVNGKWHVFEDIQNMETKNRIQNMVVEMK